MDELPPVILLAFAKNSVDELPYLKPERIGVKNVLETLEIRNLAKLEILPDAVSNDIIDAIEEYGDRIILFHFSGHSDGKHLKLNDKDVNGRSIARLLARLPKLNIVILNGCATKGHVDILFEEFERVPGKESMPRGIIATSNPVLDSRAKDFAIRFYRKLSLFGSIQDCITDAMNIINVGQDVEFQYSALTQYRFIYEEPEGVNGSTFPWGFYFREKDSEYLKNWAFPGWNNVDYSVRYPIADFELNTFVANIFHWDALISDYEGVYEDEAEKIDEIIKKFPWPISAQITNLVSNDELVYSNSISRLEQIVNTYISFAQLNYFVLLADIWRMSRSGIIKTIDLEFESIFGFDDESPENFAYLSRAYQLLCFVKEKKVEIETSLQKKQKEGSHEMLELFIPELEWLSGVFVPGREENDAYIFLESLRYRIMEISDFSNFDLEQLCINAEYCLALLLNRQTFWIDYQMIGVRDISVEHYPHIFEANFQHTYGNFNTVDKDRLRIDKKPKSYANYLHSRSVQLLKDIQIGNVSLPLSPFYIDKNAINNVPGNAMDLYTFVFKDIERGEYFYLSCDVVISDFSIEKEKASHGNVSPKKIKVFNTGEFHLREKRAQVKGFPTKMSKPYSILKDQFDKFQNDFQQ